jgi:hypothetical protein
MWGSFRCRGQELTRSAGQILEQDTRDNTQQKSRDEKVIADL